MTMPYNRLVLAFVTLFTVSGCAGDKIVRTCPQIAYLRDLAVASDYGRDAPEKENLVSVAAIKRIEGGCDYGRKGVSVDFELHLAAEKGPRLGGDQASFPYFVAIVTPDNDVLSKELMTAVFNFEEKGKPVTEKEDVHVFIPLAEKEDAVNYRVLTGFQLTDTQLNLARDNVELQERRAR